MIKVNGPVGYIEFVGDRRVDILRTCKTMTNNDIKLETVDGVYILEASVNFKRLYNSEGKEQNDFVKCVLYK